MIDTFFINLARNTAKMKYQISLFLIFVKMIKSGQVIYYKMMEEKHILIIKKLKTILTIILETTLLTLLMILAVSVFLLMMVSYAIMDNIHDFCVYLFKRERLSKPSLCLTKSYRLLRIGINKLKKGLSGLKSHIRFPN